jgi:hypothetical protein
MIGVDAGIRLGTQDAEADHADLLRRWVDADADPLRRPGVPAMFPFRDPDGSSWSKSPEPTRPLWTVGGRAPENVRGSG